MQSYGLRYASGTIPNQSLVNDGIPECQTTFRDATTRTLLSPNWMPPLAQPHRKSGARISTRRQSLQRLANVSADLCCQITENVRRAAEKPSGAVPT
jgi:hypothetical protein